MKEVFQKMQEQSLSYGRSSLTSNTGARHPSAAMTIMILQFTTGYPLSTENRQMHHLPTRC
jgi:hypothetical protein